MTYTTVFVPCVVGILGYPTPDAASSTFVSSNEHNSMLAAKCVFESVHAAYTRLLSTDQSTMEINLKLALANQHILARILQTPSPIVPTLLACTLAGNS
jgi:hypothetical protein